MRRCEFISLKAYIIAGCFAVITPADLAHAQPKKPTATEDTSPLKSSAKTFRKIPTANGLAAATQRLGKWTLAATRSASVRSMLVARILLLF